MSCGHPSDQKLFKGYIRGVRVTATWGATCITAENHLQAYFDLWEMVCVSGTDTMVTNGFPLGLVWFQDRSLVAVALLCYSGGIV